MTEAFGSSLPQEGRPPGVNEDAFWIRPAEPTIIALADGAGAAQQAARKALRQFEQLVAAGRPTDIELFPAWSSWLRALDLGMSGGPSQSTFVAVAVLGDRLVGAAAGDSRAYLWTRDGELRLLTDGASKTRLGSRRIVPFPIHSAFGRGDIVLLLTDGAWTPLTMDGLRACVARAALLPLAELPEVVLREASRRGIADDMTVVAARRT
jgi:serine/threonine protein phosphatase PrpC